MPEYPGAPRGPATANSSPVAEVGAQYRRSDAFYEAVFEEAFQVARGTTRRHHAAEDIAAVVATKMYAELETTPALATDHAFRSRRIHRRVVNEWHNIRRGEKRGGRLAEKLAEKAKNDAPPLGLSPDGDFDFNERQREIDAAVGALTPELRDAFTLVRTQPYTVREAAQILRRPLSTVKSDLRRAMIKIRIAAGPDGTGEDIQ